MAKLGSFDDLPSNAQNFLINYRNRLEMMGEAESTAVAVREVYRAYYGEMGGIGAAPEPQARKPTVKDGPAKDKLIRLATRPSIRPTIRKSVQALLIFASMVALILTYTFLMR
jgi:hypothetical protein